MSQPRRTFSEGDPFKPLGRPSSSGLSSFSNSTSPGTAVTEPDRAVEMPVDLESKGTLLFFGLHDGCASQIWKKWVDNSHTYHGDFGLFARDHMRELVRGEGCDIGEPGVDWRPSLRKIGANEALVSAICGVPGDENGIRLTQSAAEWVDKAIEWRWEWLLHIHEAS